MVRLYENEFFLARAQKDNLMGLNIKVRVDECALHLIVALCCFYGMYFYVLSFPRIKETKHC